VEHLVSYNIGAAICKKFIFECFARYGQIIARNVTGNISHETLMRSLDVSAAFDAAIAGRGLSHEAIESALPPERKRAARRRPKFAAICEFIDQRLKEDEQAPRKQRHTAHRIYERLRVELPGVRVSERTVRQYVRERRAQAGFVRAGGDGAASLWMGCRGPS
jgi:hypothetical protein